MRLLFLTSSLEPGRDGVGDYVRLLAGECVRRGHACAVIALHDPPVSQPQEIAGAIPTLRLPVNLDDAARVGKAAAFRDTFRPDWISLQFVPYGFQSRGIVWGASPMLKKLIGDVPLHLMFHELWSGVARSAPFRQQVMGVFQRLALRRLLSVLRPQAIATSNPVYVEMLRRIGVPAAQLPLFGNIPLIRDKAAVSLPGETADPAWTGVFFGSIHPEWKPEPFLGMLRRAAQRTGRRASLVWIGRPGTSGPAIWAAMRRDAPDISFVELGEQSDETISALLQSAGFGIATSPWRLMEKSGTVAAMLDHGLPVIVTRDDFQPRFDVEESGALNPLLHRCDAALEEKLVAGLPKHPPRPRLDDVATAFLNSLAHPPLASKNASGP